MDGLSERVISISSTCIRSLARVNLRVELSQQDARELAIAHPSIAEAIESLQRSLKVHSGVGHGETITALAIAEAKVDKEAAGGYSERAIIQLRKKTYEAVRRNSKAIEEERRTAILQELLSRDMKDWERGYEEFLASLNDLFGRTYRRLELLNLDSAQMSAAVGELEETMLRAIHKASSIDR